LKNTSSWVIGSPPTVHLQYSKSFLVTQLVSQNETDTLDDIGTYRYPQHVSGPRTSPDGVSSVERALSLLEHLGEGGNLGATELAARLGVAKATAFRLARTLQRCGYVVQDPDATYRLGPRCLTLAAGAASRIDLRTELRPVLEALHAVTDETIQLTVLSGRDVIYIEQLLSRQPVLSVSTIGGRSPPHCVSPGLAQLAAMNEDQLEAFLVEPLQRYTDSTITDPDRLREELAAIRRRGYAVNRGGFRPDVGGTGAIIRDHQGRPAAAISVCVPMFRFDRMDIAVLGAHVRRAAAEASRSLGLREPRDKAPRRQADRK
jgi:DNA-binding IclR family transcriptional regulator